MAARFSLLLLIFLWSHPLTREAVTPTQLVVWNVGQGQWVTLVEDGVCWHFDTGGEHAPWGTIEKLCRDRANPVSYSHWDWDHLSFASKLRRHLPSACLLYGPVGHSSPHKETALASLPPCHRQAPFPSWVDENGRSSNDKSRVVLFHGCLIPGDSTAKEEKFWVQDFQALRATHLLVLGHHGSASSTSQVLLRHLPALRAAISSARFKKYGHPHPRVVRELRRFGVPLLRTEEWGNLHFDL
jgi:competence protein ComEC